MAKLERIELMKVPEYDDKMIEGLIELRERFGVQAPFRRIRANLIDRTVSETQPQYVLTDDEDLVIRPQYLADSTVNLGSHHTEEAAIARCQEHHDTIYGRNA